MIDKQGWFDWAIRQPGPAHGVNGGRNGGRGMIPHSAVGNWDTLDELAAFLASRVNAPPGQRASWAATNLKDGRLVQHYSVWEQTWTSGCSFANNGFFAFENAGGGYHADGSPNYSEPLTPPQESNIIHIGRDLMAVQGWKPRRPVNSGDLDASLFEHTEMIRFGAAATACPSKRIRWSVIVPALLRQEEEDMKSFLCWVPGSGVHFIGPNGARYINTQATVDELGHAFGYQFDANGHVILTQALSWATVSAIGVAKN